MITKLGPVGRFVAFVVLTGARTSSAAIFSSISYNQQVGVDMVNGNPVGKGLKGSSLPVSETLSVETLLGNDGPTAQATYNFSDTGNFASLQISTSESLNGPGQQATEGS